MASLSERHEYRDNMMIDWDVPITMDDGLVLRADVFRPAQGRKISGHSQLRPVRQGPRLPGRLPSAWSTWRPSIPTSPRAPATSTRTGKWSIRRNGCRTTMSACASTSRGTGCSPGFIDHLSPRETKDFYDCIEWAGVQPWSNGKVGLNGISYYGINQWHVASLQPPHLAAMCIWEGCADCYRDMTHHGGILCDVPGELVRHAGEDRAVRRGRARQAQPRARRAGVRAGDALARRSLRRTAATSATTSSRIRSTTTITRRARRSLVEGDSAAVLRRQLGRPAAASARQFRGLRARRVEAKVARSARHRALDAFLYRLRTRAAARGSSTTSCTARKTAGTSSRGCCCRFAIPSRSSSSAPRTNGRSSAPSGRSSISIRPTASLSTKKSLAGEPRRVSFEAMGDGVTFLTPPLAQDTEITGPSALKLFVSSSTSDADLFIVLRVFSGDLKEVVFQGAIDPHTPIAQGWLRASHRKLDKKLSTALPALSHPRREAAAEEGRGGRARHRSLADLDRGADGLSHRRSSIRGKDYEYGGGSGGKLSNFKNELTGCGPFLHDDPLDRPHVDLQWRDHLHFGGGKAPYVLLPIIPPKKGAARKRAASADTSFRASKCRGINAAALSVSEQRFCRDNAGNPLRPQLSYRVTFVEQKDRRGNEHAVLASPGLQRHFVRRAAVSAWAAACR